jgi:hypothetical protein
MQALVTRCGIFPQTRTFLPCLNLTMRKTGLGAKGGGGVWGRVAAYTKQWRRPEARRVPDLGNLKQFLLTCQILKIPALLLAFHHGVFCHLAAGPGGDPGCGGGGGLTCCLKMPQNLWSDALRQWTKSVVSSLQLEVDRGKKNCSAYIVESGAKFWNIAKIQCMVKKCCKICYCNDFVSTCHVT